MNDEELKNLRKVWKIKYEALERDLDNFEREWHFFLKKCKCRTPECKHFKKEEWKRFGERMDRLFNQSITLNGLAFKSILQRAH